MKNRTTNQKILLIIMIALFAIALIISAVVLITRKIERDTATYINVYINGELVELDMENSDIITYLHKYDGQQVKVEPKIVYKGKEDGVAGKFYRGTSKYDQSSVRPNKEIPMQNNDPLSAGYYEITINFGFNDPNDWVPFKGAQTRLIRLIIYNDNQAEYKIYTDRFRTKFIEEGETHVYQYDGKSHCPSIWSYLSNGEIILNNRDRKIYRNGKEIQANDMTEKGQYMQILSVAGDNYRGHYIKGYDVTVHWIIE